MDAQQDQVPAPSAELAPPRQWTAVLPREPGAARSLRDADALAAHCQRVGCVVGARVLYQRWPGMILETRVRSEAWLLGDRTPVVAVEGVSGGVALEALYVARSA